MSNAVNLLPSATRVKDAVALLLAVIEDQPQHEKSRHAKASLHQVALFVDAIYAPDVDVTVTDATDASVAVAAAADGEIADAFVAAFGAASLPSKGRIIEVQGTGDTTDDGLEAALDAKSAADFSVFLTYADTAEASLALAFASSASIPTALGRDLVVGDVIRLNGTGDTTDNAFEAAKGSAVAAGDRFVVTNVATPAVTYISAATPAAGQLYQFTSATALAYVGQAVPNVGALFAEAIKDL